MNFLRRLALVLLVWLAAAGVVAAVPLAYQTNYDDGFAIGYPLGYEGGFIVGQERGFAEGTEQGGRQGYDEGWDDAYEPAYDRAYTLHYSHGRDRGYVAGLFDGFDRGYAWAEAIARTYYVAATGAMINMSGLTFHGPIGGFGSGLIVGHSTDVNTNETSGGTLTIGVPTIDWATHYHDQGLKDGKAAGYAAGDIAGYDESFPAAFAAAFDAGFLRGSESGAKQGTAEGKGAGLADGWDAGYGVGEPIGFDAGADYFWYGAFKQPDAPAWFTGGSVRIPEPSGLVVASVLLGGLLGARRRKGR